MQKITPHLWFDKEAEAAAEFYVSVFKDGKILDKSYYTEAGHDVHGMPPGSVMVVEFELMGQRFMALNGGPIFKFNESISFLVECKDQAEIDYYWDKLKEGGDESAQQCGWLKDKYGLSWQVTPGGMAQSLRGPNGKKVTEAFLQMKKIDMDKLKEAAGS